MDGWFIVFMKPIQSRDIWTLTPKKEEGLSYGWAKSNWVTRIMELSTGVGK